MNNKYLGETIVDVVDTPFKDYKEKDWALYFIGRYGQIDGEHHKTWVLDQVVRIICGTPLIIKLAKWSDGTEEYRVSTNDVSSVDYDLWVKKNARRI